MQHTALTKDVLEVLENLELQAPSGRDPSWMYQEGSFSLYMSDSGEVLSLFVSLLSLSLSLFLCYVLFIQFMICCMYNIFIFYFWDEYRWHTSEQAVDTFFSEARFDLSVCQSNAWLMAVALSQDGTLDLQKLVVSWNRKVSYMYRKKR